MFGHDASAATRALPTFLASGGEMGALMRAHDWTHSSLGMPEGWPAPLRTALRLLLNSQHPMYIWWGPELLCFYNDAYRPSIGSSRHPHSLGRPARDVWSEIWTIIGPQIDQVMSGRGGTWHENQLVPIHRNGRLEEVYWTYSYNPIDDEAAASGVGGVLVICTETTQQVLNERAMRAAEARWRELFDQAPGFMCVLRGPEHRYEYCNPRYHELVGRRDFLGQTVLEAFPEVEQQGFVALLDRVYRTGTAHRADAAPIELPNEAQSGALRLRYLDFVYQPVRDTTGAVAGVFVEGSDVTDRVLASRALQESEARFRTLAENIPTLCWMADEAGSIFWFNSRWYEYTGTTPEQMTGWGWQSVHSAEILPGVLEQWRRSIATGSPFEMVFPLKSSTGEFRPFLTRVVPLRDSTGRIVRWFGTNTDISKQLAAEAALREADRRKDEFLATLAHELRNPLAPVRNAAKVLRAPNATASTRDWATSVIDRQITAMSSLLDDLLEISRITRGQITLQKQRTSVASIIETSLEIARPLIDSRRHQLVLSFPQENIDLTGDPLRLSQVFSNLLTNAAKYMEAKGRIEVRATRVLGGVEISVVDQGVGLEGASLSTIFEMFSQVDSSLDRSEGGLGIGLALVKGLVELHGGRVSASSIGLGHGSTFTVFLPRTDVASQAAVATETVQADRPKDPRKILVVDDNKDAAQTLGALLELAGHEVWLAHDGEHAVAMAGQFLPDVAVVDIGLPKLNGYTVARTIRGQPWGQTLVMIALTGWGHEEDKRRALAAGFDHHLTKPVDPERVEALIPVTVASRSR